MVKRADNLVLPIDNDSFEQNVRWLPEVERFGYGSVELCDGTEKVLAPKRFYDFCLQYDIKPFQAINMILSDFVTRYYDGNSSYEQGILNRVRTADIPESDRQKILKIMLEQ